MKKHTLLFFTLLFALAVTGCSAAPEEEFDPREEPMPAADETETEYVNRLDGMAYDYDFSQTVTLTTLDGSPTVDFTEHIISGVTVREYFNCVPSLNIESENGKALNSEMEEFIGESRNSSVCVNVIDNTVNVMVTKEEDDGLFTKRVFAYNLAYDKAFDMEEFLHERGVFRGNNEDFDPPEFDETKLPAERHNLCAFILNKNSAALYFPRGETSVGDEESYAIVHFGPKNHELISDFDSVFTWVASHGDLDFNVQIMNDDLGNYLNVTYGYPLLKDDSPQSQEINEKITEKQSMFTSSNLYKSADGKVFVYLLFEDPTNVSGYCFAYDTVTNGVVDIEAYLVSRGVDLAKTEEDIRNLERHRYAEDSEYESEPAMIRLKFDGEPIIFVPDEDSAILHYEVYYKEKNSDRLVCYSEEYLLIFDE